MTTPAINVDGLDQLRKGLRQAKDKGLNDAMKSLHAELAAEITRRALPHVPVDTGALKRSVRSSGTVRDAVGRAGKASVPYAPRIHWGAKSLRPRPFLREAAEKLEKDVVDRYDRAVAEMLEKVLP